MTPKPLLVKTTGGGTAQLLALINAIYLSAQTVKPFIIKHYPYSTGTYWPLEIEPLLHPSELEAESDASHWSRNSKQIVGGLISDFALKRRGLNLGKIYFLLQELGLDSPLRRIRKEIVIGGKKSQLLKVKKNTHSVTGNYVPIMDFCIANELQQRFSRAGLPNPFSKSSVISEFVLHYRLGDMRRMPSRIPGLGGHGVVDPVTFRRILREEKFDFETNFVTLVSDEPEIAVRALEEVGIKCVMPKLTSFWDDLKTIANAKVFIGSMSQFSMFGALLCMQNGGRPILPSTAYGEIDMQSAIDLAGFSYFPYIYLSEHHWMFRI